jgi:hypothetical protein
VSLDPLSSGLNNHQWVSNDGSNLCELSFSESRACSCRCCKGVAAAGRGSGACEGGFLFSTSEKLKQHGKAYPIHSSSGGSSNTKVDRSKFKYEFTSVSGFQTGDTKRTKSTAHFDKRRNCIR